MRRLSRIWLLLVFVAAAVGIARPADALSSLTWEFVVDCNNSAGTDTSSLGFGLPSGVYAVTVEGACIVDVDAGRTITYTAGTPCTVNGTPVTCVTAGNVSNVPAPVCWVVTTGVGSHPCSGPLVETYGCTFVVVVSSVSGSACMTTPVATFVHGGGNMNARFVDPVYGDNVGYFLVTVEWTHL